MRLLWLKYSFKKKIRWQIIESLLYYYLICGLFANMSLVPGCNNFFIFVCDLGVVRSKNWFSVATALSLCLIRFTYSANCRHLSSRTIPSWWCHRSLWKRSVAPALSSTTLTSHCRTSWGLPALSCQLLLLILVNFKLLLLFL